jgi:uncharacterized membrane protein (GlpM family)
MTTMANRRPSESILCTILTGLKTKPQITYYLRTLYYWIIRKTTLNYLVAAPLAAASITAATALGCDINTT